MPEQKSIKDTLSTIRKALEEENTAFDNNDNIMVLNKLVKNDGTIDIIENQILKKEEIKDLLNKKISEIFDDHLDKWLDNNIPNYLDKYFKKK